MRGPMAVEIGESDLVRDSPSEEDASGLVAVHYCGCLCTIIICVKEVVEVSQ